MNKRNDLQWLRALAIFAVCAFHLQPKKIPYGYLGVDIFFVISGYLMTVILHKKTNLTTFYLNRVKRIFPTYIFIIAILCIAGYFLLLPMDFDFFKSEVIWSIFFVNNMYPIFHQKQYFEMVSEYKFLLHTWSLGVEIQFYIIAPFLIKFVLTRFKPLHWTIFIGFSSFLFQLFVPNENIAFGLVFCRIWQFLVGTFVYCLSSKEPKNVEENCTEPLLSDDNKKAESLTNYHNFTILSLLGMIVICFYPLSHDRIHFISIIFRVIITLFTGLFVALNSIQPLLLPNRLDSFFVYIGDASYVIYLIHWPIIVYFEYFSMSFDGQILFIVTLASIVYHCVEIPLRKQSIQTNICILTFFYLICVFFCFINNEKNSPFPNPIKQNEIDAKSCGALYYENCEESPLIEKYLIRPKSEKQEKYCSYKLNPNANKTILISGNSYAYFQNRGIIEAIKESKTQFKEAFLIVHPSCSIIAGKFNNLDTMTCENFDGSYDIFLNKTKPDVIIHSARLTQFITKQVNAVNISEEDEYYLEFKKSILNLAKYTSKLILIEPNPLIGMANNGGLYKIARALRASKSFPQFNVSREAASGRHDPSWNRVKKAVKSCKNCIIIPTHQLYCQQKICYLADPRTQLSMYCDYSHLTPRYSVCLKPSIIEAIDKDKPNMAQDCPLSLLKN